MSLRSRWSSISAFFPLALAGALGLGTLFLQSGGELQALKAKLRPERGLSSEAELKARTAKWNELEAEDGRPTPAFLTRYEALDKKVLKSDAELTEVRRMLSSRPNLEAARAYLGGIETEVSLHQTIKRIEVVDFLIEAERWDANPSRGAAVQAMRDFILDRQDLSELTEKSQRALYGDKIELYNALRAADPAVADAIKSEAIGSSLEKLIDFAERHSEPTDGLRAPSAPDQPKRLMPGNAS